MSFSRISASGVTDASRCRRKLEHYARKPEGAATTVFDPGREALDQNQS